MLSNLQWMATLHGLSAHASLLCHPPDVAPKLVDSICTAARAVFPTVNRVKCPGSSNSGWPRGPNTAWQTAARHMAKRNDEWLWLEADAIPVKCDWLSQLQSAYTRHGKAFMGPVVAGMGHCNGVAVYPANAAKRCPRAMSATRQAWDYVMRDEMIRDCHDAGDLIFHFWGLVNDRPHPTTGNPPHFASMADVKRWIPESAVLVHRVKDSSLQKVLNENLHLNRQLATGPSVA